MTARKPSDLAGQTVTIRSDARGLGGQKYRVEDWWINIAGRSWTVSVGNPAAMQYAMRARFAGLPPDDDVLYGKVGHLGHLVHLSEIEVPQ